MIWILLLVNSFVCQISYSKIKDNFFSKRPVVSLRTILWITYNDCLVKQTICDIHIPLITMRLIGWMLWILLLVDSIACQSSDCKIKDNFYCKKTIVSLRTVLWITYNDWSVNQTNNLWYSYSFNHHEINQLNDMDTTSSGQHSEQHCLSN